MLGGEDGVYPGDAVRADSVLATSVDLAASPQATTATLDGVAISYAVARI